LAAGRDTASPLRLLAVAAFLDEERNLPRFLASIAAQTRAPDELVLVDDGSRDGSPELAQAFADDHSWARVLRRSPRPPQKDRLAAAHELIAFQWGVGHSRSEWDVIAKLDADIEFPPDAFATILGALEADPALGMAGSYLSAIGADGLRRRERSPADHVRGPNKFYRRACFEQIAPLPAHLGWDTIDEVRARMRGWRTASIELPGGDALHMRPVGSHDGVLRGWRRWGTCAWGYGEHPLHVLAVAVQRAGDAPPVLGSLSYVAGWVGAALRRAPRAEPEVRAYVHRDQLRRLRRRAGRIAGRRSS
jgi:poly-beta-1,6-N-acetyl-D-glucosamine synthase